MRLDAGGLDAGRPPANGRGASILSAASILLFATGLRMMALNTRPLWYDEAFAVLFAEKGFRAMLAGTLTPVAGAAADVHPIVYYTMLNGWMGLVGQPPLAVRLPSVFFGLITVAVIYAIGRRLFGKTAAIVAALIVSASPFQVYYSQEARMYAPLGLACAATILFFISAVRPRQSQRDPRTILYWLGVSVSAAAAMYMQNLAAFFLLAFGLTTLARPKIFAKVAAAGALAFALWLPWFLNVPGQFAKLRQAYWVARPDFVTLLQTALVYHVGEEMVATRLAPPLALFAALLIPILLFFQLYKERKAKLAVRAAWCAAVAGGMPALLLLASLYQPVYIQRALLPAGLMYALALGWLLAAGRQPAALRWTLAALLAAISAAGLWAHYSFAQFPRPNFPAADAYLRQRLAPGDVVVHSNKLTFLPMYFYDRGLPQAFMADPPGSGSDTLALPTQEVLGLRAVSEPQEAVGGARRLWFVIFDKALAEYLPGIHPHLAWLQENFRQQSFTKFDDLGVYEFVRP